MFKGFGKNKKNKLHESAPVIARSGRIGRVSVNEDLADGGAKEPEKKGIGYEQTVESTAGVSISDAEFLNNGGQSLKKRKKKKDSFTQDSKEDRAPFPLLPVVGLCFATVLIMSLVVNFVQVNEYTKQVAQLQKQVETMSKERTELEAELDEKDSIDALRDYMEKNGNTLGMIEEDKMHAPVVVTPEKSDGIEDYEVPSKEEPIVTVVLNALARNLGDVWNKFLG